MKYIGINNKKKTKSYHYNAMNLKIRGFLAFKLNYKEIKKEEDF